MAVTALIQFTQNAVPGTAGQAYVGTSGLPVTVANQNNASILSWKIELVYAPPGSALEVPPGTPTVLGSANSSTPSALFTPDTPGSYRIVLTVFDAIGQTGNLSKDIRNFVVPTANRSFIIPPYQKLPDPLPLPASGDVTAKPDEMNYGAQPYGWAGNTSQIGLHQLIKTLDSGSPFSVRTPVVATSPTTIVAGAAPRYIPVDTANVTWPSSAGTLNITAGMLTGHILVIQDTTGSASTKNITVVPQGGETVNGLSSFVIAQNYGSATMVKTGATTWMLWGAKVMRESKTVVAGVNTSGSTGFAAVGGVPVNLTDYPNLQSIQLNALIDTTSAVDQAEIRLWNTTTASVISGSVLSTPNSSPTLVSASVTLTAGANNYEVQLRCQSFGDPTRVACTHAHLLISWLQT